MGDLIHERRQFIGAMWEALESLSGEQVVGIVSIDEAGSLTLRTWLVDETFVVELACAVGEGRWNASKSL